MSIKSWFRGSRFDRSAFHVGQPRPRGRKIARTGKPFLETLEARLAPAAISWNGSAGDLSWDNKLNWSPNQVPTSADDVTISISVSGTINISGSSDGVHTLNDTTGSLSIASGGALSIAASALTSTFGKNVTVQSGATLAVGAGPTIEIGIPSPTTSVTLTDNGLLSFGSNDTVTLNSSAGNGTTAQIVVSGGGDLKANGTTFAVGGNGTSQIVVNSDAVLNAGDLVGNAFNLPLFIPAIDVQYLYGSANNNLQFQNINIQPVNLTSGQSVALNAIGTQSTANLRYIFPSNLTIGAGATLSVGPNVNVQLSISSTETSVTLTDNGILSFGTNDAVTLYSSSGYGTTAQIVVSGGGDLKASGTTFAAGGNGTSQIVVNSDAALNAGDLVGNAFNLPLFIPAIDVQYLYGSANNNLQFQNINIQPVNLTSGQSVALNAIGTQSTANLRYIFPSNLTIGHRGTLSVGPNVNVQIANLVDHVKHR